MKWVNRREKSSAKSKNPVPSDLCDPFRALLVIVLVRDDGPVTKGFRVKFNFIIYGLLQLISGKLGNLKFGRDSSIGTKIR